MHGRRMNSCANRCAAASAPRGLTLPTRLENDARENLLLQYDRQSGEMCELRRKRMNLKANVEEFGFALRRNALGTEQLAILLQLFHPASEQTGVRRRGGGSMQPETFSGTIQVSGRHLTGAT